MAVDSSNEIVITITGRKLVALVILSVISIATVYSYIGALFAFIAPSEDVPLQVTSFGTFDTGNSPKTSYTRGQTVRMKATVEKATAYYYQYYYYVAPPAYYYYNYYYYDFVGSTSCKVILTLKDAAGQPVYFTSSAQMIDVGASVTVTVDYPIAATAAVGTWTGDVMVWSDWLPSGVALAPAKGEVTFSVS